MIVVDRRSVIPVQKQIALQIKKEIILGRLRQGDKLPPVRELAQNLGVNVNTVLKALDELVNEGVLIVQHGKGYFVSESEILKKELIAELEEIAGRLKENGVDRSLAMILLMEVWPRG
ncbi:MAG: hypothetical protein PWP37_1071 [Thermotogota bacterium]|nr:hypothetical protein [Thermotogota bacterium]